jgi:hypothetical protein
MPSIPLDTKRWTKVNPVEDEAVTVTARGFACYWSRVPEPPELASEGTELAKDSAVTVEEPNGRWFRAKEVTAGEALSPSTLEVSQSPESRGEQISTAQIDNGAVTTSKLGSEAATAAKIGKEAVTSAKALPATLPAAGAEKSVVVGTAGVQRKITAVHVGDGVETKVKVKHSFTTEAVNVVVQKGAETKKPGANYLNAAGAGNFTWEPISASEVEVTFGTAPIAKFESFVSVYG